MCLAEDFVLVFDIDDTLFLERDYVFSGFEAVGAHVEQKFGCEGFGQVCRRLFDDGVRGSTFDLALSESRLHGSATAVQELVEVYRHHVPSIDLEADAKAILDQYAGTTSVAVISDGALVSQSNKARALGLTQWCDPIFLTDQWGRTFWKPHSRAYENVQAHFRVPGHRCVYVGDNPQKDFLPCRRLGWKSVRIRRSGGFHASREANEAECADAEIRDLWSLPVTLDALLAD